VTMETVVGFVVGLFLYLVGWVLYVLIGWLCREPDLEILENTSLDLASRAIDCAEHLASHDSKFTSAIMSFLPESGGPPAREELDPMVKAIDKYVAMVRRDIAKALYTLKRDAKFTKTITHGFKRDSLCEMRDLIFKFGDERAIEFETMFWLIVRVRLLRHALVLNIKQAKGRHRYNIAAKWGGRVLNTAATILGALDA